MIHAAERDAPAGLGPEALQRAKGRVLLVVFLTVFLDLIGFGLVIPLLPLYVKSMGGGPATVGFIPFPAIPIPLY